MRRHVRGIVLEMSCCVGSYSMPQHALTHSSMCVSPEHLSAVQCVHLSAVLCMQPLTIVFCAPPVRRGRQRGDGAQGQPRPWCSSAGPGAAARWASPARRQSPSRRACACCMHVFIAAFPSQHAHNACNALACRHTYAAILRAETSSCSEAAACCAAWEGTAGRCDPGVLAPAQGLKWRLEVYKTKDKGWAVRSWDTIPHGAYVTSYVGACALAPAGAAVTWHIPLFFLLHWLLCAIPHDVVDCNSQMEPDQALRRMHARCRARAAAGAGDVRRHGRHLPLRPVQARRHDMGQRAAARRGPVRALADLFSVAPCCSAV